MNITTDIIPVAIAHSAIYEKYRDALIRSNLENDDLGLERFILTDDVNYFKRFWNNSNYHFIDIRKYSHSLPKDNPPSYHAFDFTVYRFSILEAALGGYSKVIYLECDSIILDIRETLRIILKEDIDCIMTNIIYGKEFFCNNIHEILKMTNIPDIFDSHSSEGWFQTFCFSQPKRLISYINTFSVLRELTNSPHLNTPKYIQLNQVGAMFLLNSITLTPVKHYSFPVKNLTVYNDMEATHYE